MDCEDCRHAEDGSCEDGHIDCDSCRGTAIGWDRQPGTCSSCKGRGWNPCEEVEEDDAYGYYKDRRREAAIERAEELGFEAEKESNREEKG